MKKIYRTVAYLGMAGLMVLCPVTNTYAMKQDETVYVKLQNSGETKDISVVEHLENDLHDMQLVDATILENIENLNGFEGYVVENGKVKWDANGKDIYYRGTANKALPIEVKATYKLNSEEKTLDEMVGQAGKVEIRLQYRNLSKVGDLYTPFVVAVATTLDESKVSNVEVTNGKATGNGRTVAVAAVAAPGLYESLKLDELQNTDEVVINFETTEFELNEIYSIVTPKLLDSADLSTFSELDALYASTDQLASSSQALVAGSEKLAAGVGELRASVAAAGQKLQMPTAMLDDATLVQLKTQAAQTAEQSVEAQRTMISQNVASQVEQNEILMSALRLQAAAMCEAQAGVSCPEPQLAAVFAQLVAGVEQGLVESSMDLAKTTARETASATAEKVALGVVETVQQSVAPVINNAINAMLGGIDQLAVGANELKDGMTQFDREGIQTLANFVNGTVRVTTNRIERLVDLAEQYDNYAGLSDNTAGTTKFIMMIEGKKK